MRRNTVSNFACLGSFTPSKLPVGNARFPCLACISATENGYGFDIDKSTKREAGGQQPSRRFHGHSERSEESHGASTSPERDGSERRSLPLQRVGGAFFRTSFFGILRNLLIGLRNAHCLRMTRKRARGRMTRGRGGGPSTPRFALRSG